MLLFRAPSVYPAQGDTWLLRDALEAEVRPGMRVLELCCGSGALAVVAAGRGADVTAVDVSRRAVLSTWLNARARGLRVRVRRGDLAAPVRGERFDVILANPPYVPSPVPWLPSRGPARGWDAGLDGRAVLDRLCREAPPLLAPGGALLIVHSAVCGEAGTVRRLEAAGLEAAVVARRLEPFGPVMSSRIELLEDRGLIAAGDRHEELVVVRAQ